MKKKIMSVMGGLMLAAILLIAPQDAFSQSTVIANIVRVQQGQADLQVRLTEVNNVFVNKVFSVQNGNAQKNPQLAILLTALSINSPVRIFYTDGNPAILNGVAIDR